MKIDLSKLINIDLSYPGISFGYESWALAACLAALDDHMPFVQNQYRMRANKALDKKRPTLEPAEIHLEISMIDEAADIHIPQFLRNGAFVQLWGFFESFVSDIATYAAKREKIRLRLRDVRGESFSRQAAMYFEHVLRTPLPWDKKTFEELDRFQDLRNIVAHRNGRLSEMSADSRKRIKSTVSATKGAKIVEERLILSQNFLAHAATVIFNEVGTLNQTVHDKFQQG